MKHTFSIHSQELNTCKRSGYEYFCEELFVVNTNITMLVLFTLIPTMISRKIVIFINITISQM